MAALVRSSSDLLAPPPPESRHSAYFLISPEVVKVTECRGMLIRGLRGGRGRAGWMDHLAARVNLHTGGGLCLLTRVHMARCLMETMWVELSDDDRISLLINPHPVPIVVKMHHAL